VFDFHVSECILHLLNRFTVAGSSVWDSLIGEFSQMDVIVDIV